MISGGINAPKEFNSIADLIKKAPTISQGPIIKNCPWCGSAPIFHSESLGEEGGRGYPGNYEYYMQCSNPLCKAIAPHGKQDDIYCSREEAINTAIKAWNKRL